MPFSSYPNDKSENKKQRIAVIGAGLAGLTAAYRLLQHGLDVHLYEARQRVGGRVMSVSINGVIAELGAQNIGDGGEAKNLKCLISEFVLPLEESKAPLNHYYYDNDAFVSVAQLLQVQHFNPIKLRAQLKMLAQSSANMLEVVKGIVPEESPLFKVLAVRLAGYEGGSLEQLSTLYIETLYHIMLGGVAAVHQIQGQEKPYVNLMSIRGGNSLLPEKLASTMVGRLHLDMPLKELRRHANGCFEVLFNNEAAVEADLVILALPCSVYKNIIFADDVIPLERLTTIKNVHYGSNAKIIQPLLRQPNNCKGLINDRVGCYFTAAKWLTMYYIGQASRFTDETICSIYHQDKLMLTKGLGDDCLSLKDAILAKDQLFCSYDGPVGYSWPNDPYAQGSYSYIAAGQEDALTKVSTSQGERVKTAFAPIGQELYFAGEHTSILMDAAGTMEAACESGERTARMIMTQLATCVSKWTRRI